MPNDENVYRILTSRAPVVTGAEPNEVEWNDLQQRLAAIEDDPKLLAALEDVDLTGLSDGDLLVWDADTSTFVRAPQASDLIVSDGAWNPIMINTDRIAARHGLRAVASGTPGTVYLDLLFGTSGVATTAARSDHVHAVPARLVDPISPGGYMSGGTRTLATRNVTLPAGKTCRVEARIDMQVRGGDPGPCYYRLNLTIDGDTHTSGAGENGFWGVSGVPGHPPFSHSRTITGTGSAINVSASISYYDGGGIYTDAGELVTSVSFDR